MSLFGEPVVEQDAYTAVAEGAFRRLRVTPRGELVTVSLAQQMVFDGRVFMVSNATAGTATAMGGTGLVATTPALLIDAPANVALIPLEVRLTQGGTVGSGDINIMLVCDSVVRYSSGGTALTIRNMRLDNPNTSACTAYTGPTAAAATAERVLAYDLQAPDVTPVAATEHRQFIWRPDPAPVLYDGASLVLYTFAATTQPSWHFSITWAEIPSGQTT